jgi:LemA protein
MKRLVINVFILAILASFSSCGYNSMVEKEERVSSQWSQVENVYQRRADLIPNLVKTVQASANFEKGTLQAVIEARAKATSINLKVDNLSQENIQKYQQAQDGLSSALSRLMMVSEAYPTLQTSSQFRDLMMELEGSENRITQERRKFNEAVEDYNAYIRKFPNNMTAGMFDFEKKGYFTMKQGSDTPPSVEFDIK